jgi:predicted RNA binding protein YcfA (HicA-like mRNA interferase family)
VAKAGHRNFTHHSLARPVTLSGKSGDDAKPYQIKAVQRALKDIES